ncbi:MAG: family 1 glycosylhydrolase [bacterium]
MTSHHKNNRREFLKVAGTAALGMAAMPAVGCAQPPAETTAKPASGAAPAFPQGFYWGVATASYQIEGAPDADGKGKSIWDTYAHTPGKMKSDDTGDVAINHYRLYTEDVRLMREMGAKAYRFSIAWPRVFPSGAGQPNPKGLDFYSRLVDELLKAGIEPFATLYHWDLPQTLQDKGGWQSRDTSKAFADYAGYVAKNLGDRIKHFFTLNEFQNFVDMGHRGVELVVQGKPVRIELAPGLKLEPGALNQVAHHAVLAHGMSVQAIRAMGEKGTKVGPAEVMFCGVPVKGNFVWSAFDNLEWTGGYGTRFGMVYVDFKTQKRTPKLSAAWFKEAARRNAVV